MYKILIGKMSIEETIENIEYECNQVKDMLIYYLNNFINTELMQARKEGRKQNILLEDDTANKIEKHAKMLISKRKMLNADGTLQLIAVNSFDFFLNILSQAIRFFLVVYMSYCCRDFHFLIPLSIDYSYNNTHYHYH